MDKVYSFILLDIAKEKWGENSCVYMAAGRVLCSPLQYPGLFRLIDASVPGYIRTQQEALPWFLWYYLLLRHRRLQFKGLELLNFSFFIFPRCMVKISVLAMVHAFYCLFPIKCSIFSFSNFYQQYVWEVHFTL